VYNADFSTAGEGYSRPARQGSLDSRPLDVDRSAGDTRRVVSIGRILGWISLLAGTVVLGWDLVTSLGVKRWEPMTFGELWYHLDRPSLDSTRSVILSHGGRLLWDSVIATALMSWAFAVLIVLGILLLIFFSPRLDRLE
jgi:hypothetical protein